MTQYTTRNLDKYRQRICSRSTYKELKIHVMHSYARDLMSRCTSRRTDQAPFQLGPA